MSDAWKKHDRPCPPCKQCGAVLFEKFWGDGGWIQTETETGRAHGPADCVRLLTGRRSMSDEELREAILIEMSVERDGQEFLDAIEALAKRYAAGEVAAALKGQATKTQTVEQPPERKP